MKITKVTILGEGSQVLRLLSEKYHMDDQEIIKYYAEKLGLYENTLQRYLMERRIYNQKFIKHLEKEFKRPYEKIVETAEAQITKIIFDVRQNIQQYNRPEDSKILLSLLSLCERYGFEELEIFSQINYGRFLYNSNQIVEGRETIKKACENAIDSSYWNPYVFGQINLAYIENEYNPKKARKILKETEEIVLNSNLLTDITYRYWYIYGVSSHLLRQYRQSKKCFKIALNYGPTDEDRLKCKLNQALIYKLEGNYPAALKIYLKIVRTKNRKMRCIIKNNIASVYFAMKDELQAQKYIFEAIGEMPDDLAEGTKINIIDTYLDINNNYSLIFLDLLSVIKNAKMITDYKKILTDVIEKVVQILIDRKNYQALKELVQAIYDLLQRGVDIDQNKLKVVYADIILYLIKEKELII